MPGTPLCHARGVARILALFIGIPAIELALLIELGRRIGTPATLGVILTTGILGATLARRQGLGVLARVQRELEAGRLPAGALLDGVMIVLASAFLITPGILTDSVGFLLLHPGFRRRLRRWLQRRLETTLRQGGPGDWQFHVSHFGFGESPFDTPSDRAEPIDVTPPAGGRPGNPAPQNRPESAEDRRGRG